MRGSLEKFVKYEDCLGQNMVAWLVNEIGLP